MSSAQSVLARFIRLPILALALAATGAHAQTRGGTLSVIASPEPTILQPALNSQVATQYVGSKIYQGLLTYDAHLKPRPELASSWTVSADGLVYTFELQKNVVWHDGKPFTAEDAVFSIDKLLRKEHPRTSLVLNNHVASIKALGSHTLEIRLKAPFPAFISALEAGSMPMMPRHLYEGTDYRSNPANQTPVGTGPFMLKEWKRGAFIRMVRNPNYWKPGLPYVDEVVFNIIPDAASRAVAFERGDVHIVKGGDIEAAEVQRLRASPTVQFFTTGWELMSPSLHMQTNLRKPPFDNVKVRQAVMHAINRNIAVNTVFQGLGKPLAAPFASSTLFSDNQNVPTYPYDMKKARALIKESGVNVGATTLSLVSNGLGSNYDRMHEYLKQQLEALGFKINLEAADAGTWGNRLATWEFDITTNLPYQYGDPALGVERLYVSKNIVKGTPFANNQGYSNSRADALWAAAGVETDPVKRQAQYSELQKILVADVANVWLMELDFPTLAQPYVRNAVTSGHNLTENFEQVWLDR